MTTTPRISASSNRKSPRSEEHTSELQSPCNLVCRLLLEKKTNTHTFQHSFSLIVISRENHCQVFRSSTFAHLTRNLPTKIFRAHVCAPFIVKSRLASSA